MICKQDARANLWRSFGLAAPVLAIASIHFLSPGGTRSEGLVDGLRGVLFGIAIGCLLIGLRAARAPRR